MAKHSIYIHRTEQTRDGRREEGVLVIAQNNKVVGEYPYASGGKLGYYSVPDLATYKFESKQFETFTPEGQEDKKHPIQLEGLRLSNSNFVGKGVGGKNVTGVIIHQGSRISESDDVQLVGEYGSRACLGIIGTANFKQFKEDYNAIPYNERPDEMPALDRKQYANVSRGREMNDNGGLFANWFGGKKSKKEEQEEPKNHKEREEKRFAKAEERKERPDAKQRNEQDDDKRVATAKDSRGDNEGRYVRISKELTVFVPHQEHKDKKPEENKKRTAEYNPVDEKVMAQVKKELGLKKGQSAESGIKDFQKEHGLKATGELDSGTLKALGVKPSQLKADVQSSPSTKQRVVGSS